MAYKSKNNVTCLGDPKQSALYFDHILPIGYIFEAWHNDGEKDMNVQQHRRAIESLVGYENIKVDSNWKRLMQFFMSLEDDVWKWFIRSQKQDYENYIPQNLLDTVRSSKAYRSHITYNEVLAVSYIQNNHMIGANIALREYIQEFAGSIGMQNRVVLIPGAPLTEFCATDEDATITLAGLQLVDTSRASWEQIVEFRRDSEARKKLRNLRLFLHVNYAGKSSGFIEDDLNKRLEDYQKSCKQWGFETTSSLLSTVLDSKSLQATVAVSTAAALLGEPIVLASTVLTGLSIEIGKIALQIAGRKHSFNKLKDSHELAYIIEAKETLP